MNITIDIDKLGGILTTNKKNEKIIILPYKESWIDVFKRKEGTNGIKLNFSTANLKEPRISENGLFQDVAIIKQNIKKETFEKLTEDQKKLISICGQISEYIGTAKPAEPVELSDEEQPTEEFSNVDDLPF